ncbi:MAG TPA: AAA family ATPase [Solirubrobacteraceae bacterium]|nr:AAA family ATPase [Solirubrobacteraceae bacterium]
MATAPVPSTTATGVDDLKALVLSFHSLIVIDTVEEERVKLLLESLAARMNVRMMEWSVTSGLSLCHAQESVYGTSDPRQLLSYIAESSGDAIYWLKDFASSLSTPQLVRQLKELAQRIGEARATTTLVVTGADVQLPDDVMPNVAYYELPVPTEAEYGDVIDNVISSVAWRDGGKIDTTGIDREHLCRTLSGMTLNQARQAVAFAALDDGRLTEGDLPGVVEMKAKTISEGGLLEYFPAEDNKHELGGFDGLKRWLEDARMGFSKEAEAMNLAPPKGILIVGVQGCGKSLAARVIAREWGLPLLKLDAGRIYDSLVGNSEKNLRKATSLAEAMSPDVLWIDEIEKGFAQTHGDADAGLSQRIFGAFLTWLQEKKREVFVVATANDLTKLPPELQRKGRFDEVFFVDLPTADEREAIWRIHLHIRNQDPAKFDLSALVDASAGFTGSEIEQCVISAMYGALHRNVPLTTQLLLEGLKTTVPLSVSRRADIEALRAHARDFVNVG